MNRKLAPLLQLIQAFLVVGQPNMVARTLFRACQVIAGREMMKIVSSVLEIAASVALAAVGLEEGATYWSISGVAMGSRCRNMTVKRVRKLEPCTKKCCWQVVLVSSKGSSRHLGEDFQIKIYGNFFFPSARRWAEVLIFFFFLLKSRWTLPKSQCYI